MPFAESLLRLALLRHRAAFLDALRKEHFARSVHLEVEVDGLPEVERVAVFVWPEPLGRTRRMVVDVVRVNEHVLAPVSFTVELSDAEQPKVTDELPPVVVVAEAPGRDDDDTTLSTSGPDGPIVWQRVHQASAKEVTQLTRSGQPVFAQVDTEAYCFRMTCPRCGRVRYSKANSIHQVFLCRVCTRTDRLRRRALAQYRARYGKRRA